MSEISNPFRPPAARCFRATVHGVAFGGRAALLAHVHEGDRLLLVTDPPVQSAPQVWVHLESGEPLGHLPNEIGEWLAPWMLQGGRAGVKVIRVGSGTVPSWRRLVVEVDCEA